MSYRAALLLRLPVSGVLMSRSHLPRKRFAGGKPFVALAVAASLLAAPLRAAGAPQDEAPPQQEYPVRFQADSVEITDKRDRFVLHGHVVVTVDRYRLTSESVVIERTPRGVTVDGGGGLSFCPCPDPPVTIGFESALAAPPTDLVLEQPTLRVGPVPIAWLPYFWLRSRSRIGLLPPKLAYRAKDGLLAGGGVHVPLSRVSGLDLVAAGYTAGGVDLDGRLYTPRSSSHVRFDHRGATMLIADLRGSEQLGSGWMGWDVDAIRGARTRTGPLSLEEAAKRWDRLGVTAARSTGAAAYGLSLSSTARRGGPLDAGYYTGPGAGFAVTPALGHAGIAGLSLGVSTAHDAALGAFSLLSEQGGVRFSGRPGPFGLDASVDSLARAAISETSVVGAAAVGASSRVELPLSRSFGEGQALTHVVSPLAEGGVVISERSVSYPLPWLFTESVTPHLSLGGRTSLGSYAGRAAASATARAGVVGVEDGLAPALAFRASGSAPYVGLRVEGGLVRSARAGEVLARLRVGREDGLHLGVRAEGRGTLSAAPSRILRSGGLLDPAVGYLDRPGWTLGSGVLVPWAAFLATAADVDYDHEHRELLGVRGSAAYRHPCGCIAVIAWARHRLARSGVDASLTIDLMP